MMTTIMMLLALALEISTFAVTRAWQITGEAIYYWLGRGMITLVFVIIVIVGTTTFLKRRARE